MKFKDYYEVLGVKRDATQEDIRNSYRKLARKYHPDVSKEADAEARFKEIGEAYKVLKDPESRASYDRLGTNWRNGQDFQPPPGSAGDFDFQHAHFGNFSSNGSSFDSMDFGDFFEQMFAQQTGRHTRHQSTSGDDVHAKLQIDLEDAYRGAQRSVSLRLPESDEHGRMHYREHTLSVTIPKGIRTGQNLRLAGQGGKGMNGRANGDLYLEISIKPHPRYRVDGRDVYTELRLAPWEAALGATIPVETPEGKIELTIPAGSQHGRKLRLKGKGIPGKQAGDLYVTLNIVLPVANTEESRQAYRAFRNALDFDPRRST